MLTSTCLTPLVRSLACPVKDAPETEALLRLSRGGPDARRWRNRIYRDGVGRAVPWIAPRSW